MTDKMSVLIIMTDPLPVFYRCPWCASTEERLHGVECPLLAWEHHFGIEYRSVAS